MKIYYIFGFFAFLMLMNSCENHQAQYEEELLRQKLLTDSLKIVEDVERLIKGEYAETMETLSAIEDTLRAIASRNKAMDKLIRKKGLSEDTEQQQLIMAQLEALQTANKTSYDEANRLKSKAQAYKVENQQIKNMIANLEKKFQEKEIELGQINTTIGGMQEALSKLETEVSMTDSKLADTYADLKVQTDNLAISNKDLEATIKDLTQKNEFIEEDAVGYITCGSRKILRQRKIITFLSMKRLTLEYQDRVKEMGTPISIFEKDEMDCGEGDIIYLLPERDTSSYQLEGAKLKILDKKMFWTTSKAVVLVKN